MDVSYAAIYLSWTLHRGILWYYYYLFSFVLLDKREPKQEIWTYNVVISSIHVRRMFSVFEITFCVCVLFLVLLCKSKSETTSCIWEAYQFSQIFPFFYMCCTHDTHRHEHTFFFSEMNIFLCLLSVVCVSATCIGFYGICSGSYFRFCFSFYLFLYLITKFSVFSFSLLVYVIVIIINIISLVVEEKLEQQDTTAQAGKNNVI